MIHEVLKKHGTTTHKFGQPWNDTVMQFHCCFDDKGFDICLPYSTKDVSFTRDEAKSLLRALTEFLEAK